MLTLLGSPSTAVISRPPGSLAIAGINTIYPEDSQRPKIGVLSPGRDCGNLGMHIQDAVKGDHRWMPVVFEI